MTQLSYFRPDMQRQRPPLPRSFVACSIIMVAIAFVHGWMVGNLVFTRPFLIRTWDWASVQCLISGGWAAVFILLGIGISRPSRRIRPLTLAVLPVYFTANIGQALLTVILGQSYLMVREPFPAALLAIGPLILSGTVFANFCLPSVGAEFNKRDAAGPQAAGTPTPLLAWSLGSMLLGSFNLLNFLLRHSLPEFRQSTLATFPFIWLVVVIAGLLALRGIWYGWFALVAAQVGMGLLQIAYGVLRASYVPSKGDTTTALQYARLQTATIIVFALIYFTAAAVGIYAARHQRKNRP